MLCRNICLAHSVARTTTDHASFDVSQDEQADGRTVGLDLRTGEPMDPTVEGVWDNYRVKRQLLHSWCVRTIAHSFQKWSGDLTSTNPLSQRCDRNELACDG